MPEENVTSVAAVAQSSSTIKFNPSILRDLLPSYYKRLFPHHQFFKWISYGDTEHSRFTNREFSFTLEDDVYLRYLSFENQIDFEKDLFKKVPIKIDLGPIMNIRPKDHRSASKMIPVERELVFDIDMTDYDEIRTCCSGADVCTKCWKFMVIACKVIDITIREDFGFEHILWVFSGRRGIHCWVCDKEARILDAKCRSAIAEYMDIIVSGGEGSISKVLINDKMHHSIRRAYKIIEPFFEEICIKEQNIFANPKGIRRLLAAVPDEMKKELDDSLKKVEGDSKKVWDVFVRQVSAVRTGSSARRCKFLVEEIQLALLYPRIDINVTKGFNHLLKSPFCVHPKTGKICVPFNPNVVQKFDPTTVPTIE